MSGPKSAHYELSRAELARQADERAWRQEQSRFRVLSDELETLRTLAVETTTTLGVEVVVPHPPAMLTGARAEVERQNADLQRTLDEVRGILHEAQDRGVAERLRDYLRGLEEFDVPARAEATASALRGTSERSEEPIPRETVMPALDRARRYLDRLAPGAELSARALVLVAEISSGGPQVTAMAIDDLRAEISRINKAALGQQKLLDRLRELEIRSIAARDLRLEREIVLARADLGSLSSGRLAELDAAISTAEAKRSAAQTRETARAAMLDALRAEGYAVLTGFETAIAHEGLLVRKPTDDYHAWQFEVDDEGVHMQVVRTQHEANANAARVRDEEAETRMCGDFPAVLERAEGAGVKFGRIRRLAPGDVPVRTLPGAAPAAKSTSAVARPKERGA